MITVLYVDDEPSLLDVAKLFLERSGDFSVDTAVSAQQGLELLKSGKYEVVVSDYQMPGMDGIEFLKVLRKEYLLLPFIIFTGKGREEIAIQAFEAGADFYLQKGGAPKAQFAELIRKITSVVERRRAEAQAFALNRLYSVLSATNHAIIHHRDIKELFEVICRIAIGIGGFRMVWAGWINKETQLIEPFASCGHIEGYLDRSNVSAEDIPAGRGPSGTALREGRHTIINDLAADPLMQPWRDEALSRGYRSVAAFPFALKTRYEGVLTLYAPEPGFFNDQIINLLDEMTGDISFALKAREDQEEREKAENNIRRTARKFRDIFNAAPNLIMSIDSQGIIVDCNQRIDDMLGYPKEDILEKQIAGIIDTENQTKLDSFLREVFSGKTVSGAIFRMQKKDRSFINVKINATGLKDKAGTYVRGVLIVEDITGRIQTEDALRESEEKYRSLFDNMLEGMAHCRMVFDDKGRPVDFIYLTVNPAFNRIIGTTTVTGKPVTEVFPGINEAYPALFEIYGRVASTGRPESFDLDFKPSAKWLHISVYSPEKEYFVAIFEDITERKRAEESRILATKKLNLLSRITRHDILNQLFILKSILELCKHASGDATKMSEHIVKGERAARAIESQILFTKDYEDLGANVPAWQNVNASVQKALAVLPMKDIQIVTDIGGIDVYADPLFEKVFYNLIDNTLKHGGNQVTAIRLSSRESDSGLILIFEDNGMGISPVDKKHLFTKGFGKNSGLGLFLSREILSITGLTIQETGEFGKGARFEITVPKEAYRFTS